jgi:hypothetical protein
MRLRPAGHLPSGPYRKEDAGKLTEVEQREMCDREMRLAAAANPRLIANDDLAKRMK